MRPTRRSNDLSVARNMKSATTARTTTHTTMARSSPTPSDGRCHKSHAMGVNIPKNGLAHRKPQIARPVEKPGRDQRGRINDGDREIGGHAQPDGAAQAWLPHSQVLTQAGDDRSVCENQGDDQESADDRRDQPKRQRREESKDSRQQREALDAAKCAPPLAQQRWRASTGVSSRGGRDCRARVLRPARSPR